MAWDDRLKEAAYTPPSGTRLTFFYENVSRQSDKKTTVFTFPDKDGAFVQDLGLGGRRYPLRVIFWGADYDLQAQAFYAALEEKGGGILEHPAYGRKEVVPTGTIRQRDDLKTGGNQAIIEVTFWESIFELNFPTADTDAATAVEDEISAYAVTAPQQFEDVLDVTTSSETVGFADKFTSGLTIARAALSNVAATDPAIKSQFDAAYDAIITNINELIGDPLRLATEAVAFIRLPVQAAALIGAKLDAYGNIINELTGLSFETSFDSQPDNAFISAQLIATASQIALIESTVDEEFTSKPEAISAAEVVIARFFQVATWGDTNRDTLGLIDTGETYQALVNATAVSAGLLVEISFTLLQERIFNLTRPRTPLDLVAELYGELDDKLDFFITTNNLVGTEILEIPAGREIRFYE